MPDISSQGNVQPNEILEKQNPKDYKNIDSSQAKTKQINYSKKESFWSSKWFKTIITIIIVMIISMAIIGISYAIFSSKKGKGSIILHTGNAGVSEDFWNTLDENPDPSKQIGYLEDSAIIYEFENSNPSDNDLYKYDIIQQNAETTISNEKETLKKEYKNDWEEKYDEYLTSIGFETEDQWYNNLVATQLIPMLSQNYEWHTYTTTTLQDDEIITGFQEGSWCSVGSSANYLCLGYEDDRTKTVALRNSFLTFLLDYQPLAVSHILIQFTYSGSNGIIDGSTISIDASNVRNWYDLMLELENASTTEPFNFETQAQYLSSDVSNANEGYLGLVSARSTGWTTEFATAVYLSLIENYTSTDVSSLSVTATPSVDGEGEIIGEDDLFTALDSNEVDVTAGSGLGNEQDNIITTNIVAISQDIWDSFNNHSTRKPVYKQEDVPSIYSYELNDGTTQQAAGNVTYYETYSQNGFHVIKTNGIYSPYKSNGDGTFSDNGGTYELAEDYSGTNTIWAMWTTLLQEELTYYQNNPTSSSGSYDLKTSYNTWVAEQTGEQALRLALTDGNEDFENNNNLTTEGTANVLNELIQQLKLEYMTNYLAYENSVYDWFNSYQNDGYAADLVFAEFFDTLYTWFTETSLNLEGSIS